MRIVIIRSNPISPDPRVEKIARALIRAGYSVKAIGWDRIGDLPVHENREGLLIDRLPIQAGFGKGMGNLPQLIRWQWGLWWWLMHHRNEFDAIHACDFDTILPSLWLKAFYGKKVIYDIFDFYADHLRATPELIKHIIRKIDLWAIGRADALILVDDARIEQVKGSKPRLTAIIYNTPEDVRDQYKHRVNPDNDGLRLAYVGLIQVERGLLQVLSVLRVHPEWQLDLAGFGGDEEQILNFAQNMPNVHWHGRVSYQQALQLNGEADILFATYDPTIANHKYASPNKIFEAMMLGKPIIVAAGTNMDRMIVEADCGCVVLYGDTSTLENTLQSLAKDPDLMRRMGENARQAYEQRYHWDIMSTRLIQLYERVLEA